QLDITNVGSQEYEFLGGLSTFVAEIQNRDGLVVDDQFFPAHSAAVFLGFTESAYYAQAILPGQTVTVHVATWIPIQASVLKLGMTLNPGSGGDPGYATWAPGVPGRYVTWQNKVNTICAGDIQYPGVLQ